MCTTDFVYRETLFTIAFDIEYIFTARDNGKTLLRKRPKLKGKSNRAPLYNASWTKEIQCAPRQDKANPTLRSDWLPVRLAKIELPCTLGITCHPFVGYRKLRQVRWKIWGTRRLPKDEETDKIIVTRTKNLSVGLGEYAEYSAESVSWSICNFQLRLISV